MPAHPVRAAVGHRVPLRTEVRPELKNAVVDLAQQRGTTIRHEVERALADHVLRNGVYVRRR